MTKTQDRQVYLDVAKGMGMLGVVASHCLVETSLGILSDWYGFFMLFDFTFSKHTTQGFLSAFCP